MTFKGDLLCVVFDFVSQRKIYDIYISIYILLPGAPTGIKYWFSELNVFRISVLTIIKACLDGLTKKIFC